MSISSAMYAAITGLNTMGTAMSVISNNIANVNTVGFKASRANFSDLLSQSTHTSGGWAQIGRGVQMAAVTQVHSQGAFANSEQTTDIAISGEGFFIVRDTVDNEEFYTRAGNFILDSEGNLTTPTGYVLQGWELNDEGEITGTPTDVSIVQYNADPEATSEVVIASNLDASADSRYRGLPLSYAWDGQDQDGVPIDGEDYVYQTSVRTYDTLGGAHDLSVYFDPVDDDQNTWEYIVCCDPADDERVYDFGGANELAYADTRYAGILQRGTITFEPSDPTTGTGGAIRNITADEYIGNDETNVTGLAAPGWTSTPTVALSGTGGTFTGVGTDPTVPVTTTFTVLPAGSAANAFQPGSPATGTNTIADADSANWPVLAYQDSRGEWQYLTVGDYNTTYTTNEGLQITFTDNGADVLNNGDTFTIDATPNWAESTPNQDGVFELEAAFELEPEPDPNAAPTVDTPVYQTIAMSFGAANTAFGTVDSEWVSDSQATTQFAGASTTTFQSQDGFASGYLQNIAIDRDGVLTGTYSNGRIENMFQISLAMFTNKWGLQKYGDNLYMDTRYSGAATINAPGEGGTGTIASNSLEQSNVDLADEFVDMIIQQRGFQANSKVITTTDTMLAELINLKR